MDKKKNPDPKPKSKFKRRAIAAAIVFALLGGASFAGGMALYRTLSAKFDPDTESESQRCLFVGTWRQVDGEKVSLKVGLHPLAKSPSYIVLEPKDFTYNTSGQQGNEGVWADLRPFVSDTLGEGTRLDEFCSAGGRITFQSFCGLITSDVFYADYGGGCYFVHNVENDNDKPKVSFSSVNVQVLEDAIS